MKKAISIKALRPADENKNTAGNQFWDSFLYGNGDGTDYYAKLLKDLAGAYKEVFYDKETGETNHDKVNEIDKFVFSDNLIWAFDANDNVIAYILYGEWCYDMKYAFVNKLNECSIIEISELNKSTFPVYLFLYMFLDARYQMKDRNPAAYTGNNVPPQWHALQLLAGGDIFVEYLKNPHKFAYEENMSLVNGLEIVRNENNPVRFYLDTMTQSKPIDLFRCTTRFNIWASSQILIDKLAENFKKNENVEIMYNTDYYDRNNYLCTNRDIKLMDHSCYISEFMRINNIHTGKSGIGIGLFDFNGILHISYCVIPYVYNFNKEKTESVLENLQEITFYMIKKRGFVVEKVIDKEGLSFGKVLTEVVQNLESLIQPLRNIDIFDRYTGIDYDAEPWSPDDIADYYGYSSVDDYEK